MAKINTNTATFNKNFGADTTNLNTSISDTEIGNAIIYGADLVSAPLNSFLYKLSYAQNFSQAVGNIVSYLPKKRYQINDIFTILVIYNNTHQIIPLKVIKNSPDLDYCQEPPISGDNVMTTENNGLVWFNSLNINREYFTPITFSNSYILKSSEISSEVQDATNSGNKNFKRIKLFRSDMGNEFYSRVKINVDRKYKDASKSGLLSCTIEVRKFHTYMKLNILDEISTNYTFENTNGVWSGDFSNNALLGCIFSIDSDKSVYLNILNSTVAETTTVVTVEYLDGIYPLLEELSKSYNEWKADNTNVVVPICNGSNSDYINVGNVVNCFEQFPVEYLFRNGYYPLGNENKNLDIFVYPGLQKIYNSSILYEVNNRWFVQDTEGLRQDGTNNKYLGAGLPNAYLNFSILSSSRRSDDFLSLTNETKFGSKYGSGYYKSSLNDSNTLYNDSFNSKVQPKSLKVFRYIKLW